LRVEGHGSRRSASGERQQVVTIRARTMTGSVEVDQTTEVKGAGRKRTVAGTENAQVAIAISVEANSGRRRRTEVRRSYVPAFLRSEKRGWMACNGCSFQKRSLRDFACMRHEVIGMQIVLARGNGFPATDPPFFRCSKILSRVSGGSLHVRRLKADLKEGGATTSVSSGFLVETEAGEAAFFTLSAVRSR